MNFEDLFNDFFDPVYLYARARSGSEQAGEDIAAAVFQKALVKLDQYDQARGVPAQWIFGIARNEVNSYLRRRALISFLPLDLFGDVFKDKDASDPAGASGETVRLRTALGGLEGRERDLVSLKFYSGMNNREISAITGLSESNVGTILYRCLARLRIELEKENE